MYYAIFLTISFHHTLFYYKSNNYLVNYNETILPLHIKN